MQINTKYNTGTSVWLMHDNKPTECLIYHIYTTTSDSETDIKYQMMHLSALYRECYLFSTKEELIQSL